MFTKLTGYPSKDRPWLKYYNENEIYLTSAQSTVFENIYNNNKEYIDDIALIYFGKKFTYKKMFSEIYSTAKAFIQQGIVSGENVAICMPAIPETVYTILALNLIGANANMLNPTFEESQLVERINETKATCLVIINELYKVMQNVIPQTEIKTVIACPAVNSLGIIIKAIKKVRHIPGTIDWNKFIKFGKCVKLPSSPKYQKDIPAIMVYSSGTTGASKGIQLTNDGINATINEGGLIGFDWKRGDRWFSQVPIWFSTGVCASTLVPLRYGITIILEPIYDFEILCQHILKYKPNFMITALGLLNYLMDKQPESDVYKGFKFLCVGGEYITAHAEQKINDWLDENECEYKLYKGYGMCECGGTVTSSSPRCNIMESAGIPTPNVIVSAFDLKTNTELKFNKRGELRILTPCRMKGYYNNPNATEKFFYIDDDNQVWCCTGDMGYVSDDGNVYVLGRISDSYINSMGEQIYLFDIERAILSVNEVRQCKVVTSIVNNEEIHVAHIALTDKKEEKNILDKILKECERRCLLSHKPKFFKIYYDALPVAPSGKLDSAKMKESINDLISIEQ